MDCEQVLGVKNDLKNTNQFTLIKAYAFTTTCCGHEAKSYRIWEIYHWYVSGGTIKINIYGHGNSV